MPGVFLSLRTAWASPSFKGQMNDENAAFAHLAAHRDVAPHQANKLTADGQAQPRTGARLLPGFGLLEMPEQLFLFV